MNIDEAKARITELYLYCQAYGTRRKEDESEESYDADMEALDIALCALDEVVQLRSEVIRLGEIEERDLKRPK